MRPLLAGHAWSQTFAPVTGTAHHAPVSLQPGWLPALLLVTLTHAGVWYGVSHWGADRTPPQPLPAVQVALITRLPPEKHVTPLQRPAQPVPRKPPARAAAEPATDNTPAAAPDTPPGVEESARADAHDEYIEPLYTAAYLNNPPPAYPLAARRRGIQGTAIIRAEVLESGDCRQAGLKKSSGNPMLDRAALDAVRKWRFVPARRGSQTLVAWVEVPITFKLTHTTD
jgi:protein TonB